ncbi:MAG: hypothetical protein L3J39_05695 [Verrucomicrobiales bacterium]|nr:hypothetical protein [Verrucomicrobiales bacterium]
MKNLRQIGLTASARLFFLGLVIILLPPWSIARGAENHNPFLERIGASAYRKATGRLNLILDEVKNEALTDIPTTGAKVAKVAPASQASDLKIKPGYVLYKLGNQNLWGNIPWDKRNKNTSLYFTNLSGEKNTTIVSPGVIGIHLVEHYRPDLEYIRKQSNINKPWIKHAIIGSLRWELDPKLAETAWHHALKEGYPEDVFSDYFAALFAMQRPKGAHKELIKFIQDFDTLEKIPTVFLPRLITLLASVGDLELIKRLQQQENPNFPWLEEDIKKLESWSNGKALPKESLLKRAREIHLERINGKVFAFAKRVGVVVPYPIPEFITQPPSAISRPNGFYTYRRFGKQTTLKNLHLSATVTIQCLGRHDQWDNSFFLRIEEKEQLNAKPSTRYHPFEEPASNNQLLSIGFILSRQDTAPKCKVSGSQLEAVLSQPNPYISMNLLTDDVQNLTTDMLSVSQGRADELQEMRTMQLDLIRYNNEAAIYLNGICYYHMPIDPSIEEIAFSYQISGVEVTFSNFSVWKLPD